MTNLKEHCRNLLKSLRIFLIYVLIFEIWSYMDVKVSSTMQLEEKCFAKTGTLEWH